MPYNCILFVLRIIIIIIIIISYLKPYNCVETNDLRNNLYLINSRK